MLSELSWVARSAIQEFCKHHDLEALYEGACHDAECCAWLFFILQSAPDKVDWFPRGKWATLQALEGHLHAAGEKQLAAFLPIHG